MFKKYKTFSVLIYSYINTSGNWKNEKLCGNTTPAGRSVFTQFRVFPIFTILLHISNGSISLAKGTLNRKLGTLNKKLGTLNRKLETFN